MITRQYKAELDRKHLSKFGEATEENNDALTTIGDEIYMQMFKSKYSDSESESESETEEMEDPEVILEKMLKEIRLEMKKDKDQLKRDEKKYLSTVYKKKKENKVDYNVVLLTNIVGNISIPDVYDIFSKYGNIENIYINNYKDPICFIRYYKKRDAKEAISKLNSYRSGCGTFQLEYMPLFK